MGICSTHYRYTKKNGFGVSMGNIAINGFGRIGRSILRIIIESNSPLNVVAINDLGNYENLAYLLKNKLDIEKNKRFMKDLHRYYKNIDELKRDME